ncbi:MAG: hypothetical protein V2B20_06400 [Pseudomonadota bacterium]
MKPSASTDGNDGPTTAAGSSAMAIAANNDSYHFFEAISGLLCHRADHYQCL